MAKKHSMGTEVMALEAAAEKSKPPVEASFELGAIREHADVQYTLMSDDILIRSGKHSGKRVSELIQTVQGRDFVGRMWRSANTEMRAVIRRYFSE